MRQKNSSEAKDRNRPGEEQQAMAPTLPIVWWKDPMIVATCALAICAVFQVVILSRQTKILRETVKMSRSDQRAWVGPSKTDYPTVEPGTRLVAKVYVDNFGKSPAQNLTNRSTFALLESGKPFVAEYGHSTDPNPPSNATLFPGQQMVMLPSRAEAVTAQQAGAIASRRSILYLYGEITYDDIFGQHHTTTFAEYLAPSHSDPSRFDWRVLDKHNDAN